MSSPSPVPVWRDRTGTFMTASEAKPKARAAAEQAIRLGADSVEAHTSMAVFELWFERGWASSERVFRRALELNPNRFPRVSGVWSDSTRLVAGYE